MKRLHTQLAVVLLAIALIAGCVPAALAAGGVTATAGNIDLTFNGTAMKLGTYNIANNNYVKLRDVAQLFKGTGKEFSVTWNGAAQRIDLASGAAYQTVGGELGALAEGVQTAVPNAASVWLDGKPLSLTAYTINGNNFFKLRDLGSAMNFAVDWDASTGFVVVDTNKGYTGEAPAPTPAVDKRAMAQAMLVVIDQAEPESYGLLNARLMDVDGDGVEELALSNVLMLDNAGHEGYFAVVYDWKDGVLDSKVIGGLAGGWFEWWTCRDTATGERGIVFQNHGGTGGYPGDGTTTFYYPSRTFKVYQCNYLNDWDYPAPGVEIDDCRRDGNAITRAEYDAIQAQNQRLEAIFVDGRDGAEPTPADNVAAVRAQLNGMI